MKTITQLTVISILLLITSNLHAQKKNVLDYYKMTEVAKEYKITKKGDKYQTQGITEEPFDVVVDFKNGYIEIKDEGTGGGTLFYQIVLFRKADGSALIAVSKQNFDGVMIGSEVDFFQERGTNLVSVKSKYYPGDKFFMDNFPEELTADEKKIFPEFVESVFDLPQNGLAISIMYAANRHVEKEDKVMYNLQQKLVKNGPIFLKWKYNKAKDQFEIVNP